ncbi:MAG TPA: TonB-dependent receptor, partial [Solimonas sp.]|nr:TonB-dependent receptor [Solimonas sp.]
MKNDFARYLWILLGLLPATALHAQTGDAGSASAVAENRSTAPPPAAEPATQQAPGQTAGPAADANHDDDANSAAADSEPPLAVIALPEEKPPVPKHETPEPPAQIEEVIVTATKRAQAARDIPGSISVIKGEELEQLGIRKVKDILSLVPGVNMQDEIAGLQRKISVRGVGPDTGTNQTVGTVMGDVPISDPYGSATIADPNPWDMRTVEVLKGPQGTLFGATSLAGLIRYVPNAPKLGRWEGKVFYDYTMLDRGGEAPSYGGAVNIPIGETFAVRASGIYQEIPGVLDSRNPARNADDIDSGKSWAGRVIALWQPTERLTVNLMATKEDRHSDDLGITTFADGSYTRDDAPGASPSDNGYSLASLDLRYAFDWATLVSLTGYQEKTSTIDIDSSYLVLPLARAGLSFLRADRDVHTHGVMQELRLVSPDDGGRLSWLIGAFYSTYRADISSRLAVTTPDVLDQLSALLPLPVLQQILANGLALTSSRYDPLDATEQALFGEASYDITDALRLTLGARGYRTKVEGTLEASGLSGGSNGATPGSTEKGWSPKVALTYKPWRDILFYGTVSRGFQFGGFNLPTVQAPNVPLTFESSTLWNYEIGLRTDWFDRTLRIDVTGFFLDWTNPQVHQGQGVNSWVDNVGGTHSPGVETTIRWLTPLKGLSIEQSASYIEARTSEPFQDVSGTEVPEGTLMPSSPR